MNNIVTAIQLLIILVLIILENHRGKLIRFTTKWFLCNENDVSNSITEFYVDLNIVLVIEFTDNRQDYILLMSKRLNVYYQIIFIFYGLSVFIFWYDINFFRLHLCTLYPLPLISENEKNMQVLNKEKMSPRNGLIYKVASRKYKECFRTSRGIIVAYIYKRLFKFKVDFQS